MWRSRDHPPPDPVRVGRLILVQDPFDGKARAVTANGKPEGQGLSP
jgi:hypothetical protein